MAPTLHFSGSQLEVSLVETRQQSVVEVQTPHPICYLLAAHPLGGERATDEDLVPLSLDGAVADDVVGRAGELTPEAEVLARALREEVPLPEKAAVDALHIAVAATTGAMYLLTWNFKHIANAVLRNRIEEVCRSREYEPPVICTPEELLGR